MDTTFTHTKTAAENKYAFLNGGGEMAELIKTVDWSKTSIGAIEQWPLSLRALASMLLRSRFPMLLMWGPELVHIYNDAFRPSLGNDGKHPAAMGLGAADVWPEIWSTIQPLFEQVLVDGESIWQEDALIPIFRNGSIEEVYWTFSYSAVRDETDRINGIMVVCCETTEKVNSLRRADENKKLLSFAIDAAELGTWDLNPATGHFTGNERLKEWFGLDPGEEIPLALAINAIQETDRERVSEAIRHSLAFASGGHYEIEYSIIHAKTGQLRKVKAMGKAVFDEDKQPSRFNGTLQDITAEVDAREQQQKLLTLVDNSVDLMSILGMDGKNSYINTAGRNILGIDQDADVSVIPISDFHTDEQILFVESEILPNVMGKGRWAGQFAIRNGKTGEIIPLYNNCHRIDDSNSGEPIGVGAVMRDMRPELNARKELEEKVLERTKELQEANDELEKRNRDLASFAYVSSHDLQEPLRKINTFISRIEEQGNANLTDQQKDFFNRIKNSVIRMQALINDLLSFSRTSSVELKFEKTDLNHLVNDVIANLHEKIIAAGAVIHIEPLDSVSVIPFQFSQLFENLISNAVKFAKPEEKPVIRITSKKISGRYCIIVEDNGIGFEPQYNERIFEVFQRLHGRTEYEGTGIGLAICKKIMENHNGTIHAEGKKNKGAVFYICLPEH